MARTERNYFRNGGSTDEKKKLDKPLVLRHVFPMMLIMWVGLGLSLVAFLLEMLVVLALKR